MSGFFQSRQISIKAIKNKPQRQALITVIELINCETGQQCRPGYLM
jgi:hypothetical protein